MLENNGQHGLATFPRVGVRRLLCVALAAVAVCGTCQMSSAALIRIKARAEVNKSVVQLQDIADVRDADGSLVERLNAVIMCPAPPPGRETRLSFADIRSRLAAQGLLFGGTQFQGKSQVIVSSAKATPVAKPVADLPKVTQAVFVAETKRPVAEPRRISVTKQHRHRALQLLTPAVERYLHRRDPSLVETDITLQIADIDVPAILGAAVSGYEISGGRAPWQVSQELSVRMLDATGEIQRVPVLCEVKHRDFVLAAKYTLPRGHVVQAADLTWIPADGTQPGVTQLEDVVGKETTSTIRANQPLREQQVQAVPLIRSNDIVTVYSRSPGITVRRLFKSRGTGAEGEAVTLVTLDGRQRVLARVTGYHEAEVIGAEVEAANTNIRFQKPGPPDSLRQ